MPAGREIQRERAGKDREKERGALKMREAQNKQILRHMEAGNSITGLEAITLFHCMRLPARVGDLRRSGVPVLDDWEYEINENGKVVKKWKKYFLA
jgi:hypothetical protein